MWLWENIYTENSFTLSVQIVNMGQLLTVLKR